MTQYLPDWASDPAGSLSELARWVLAWPLVPPDGFVPPEPLSTPLLVIGLLLVFAGRRLGGLASRMQVVVGAGWLGLYRGGDPAAWAWTHGDPLADGASWRSTGVFLLAGAVGLFAEHASWRLGMAVAGLWLGATLVSGPALLWEVSTAPWVAGAFVAGCWAWAHDAIRPAATSLFGAALVSVVAGFHTHGHLVVIMFGAGVGVQWMTDADTRSHLRRLAGSTGLEKS